MAFVIDDTPAPTASAKGRFVIDEPAKAESFTGDAATDAKLAARKNLAMGALKGASDIGATILQGLAKIGNQGKGQTEDIRPKLGEFFQEHADPSSPAFKGGELGADIAGTAGVGGTMAKGVTAVAKLAPVLAKYAPRLAAALESGGFRTGAAPVTAGERVADLATRTAAGGAVGGASAGLVNPDEAGAGAALGGALPGAAKAAGAAGKAIAAEVAPEVQALYQKAKSLGIDIPADRIVNSKPLNALASSLNYVPFSGRAGTEEKMVSQLNRAVSRTFGQDSDNVTAALRKAQTDLGDKFEMTLKGNRVKADEQLVSDLSESVTQANKELGQDSAKIIKNQVDEILSKVGKDGTIDGQAAYNIKRTLDRIGQRNSTEAYYARDLKKSLIGALNRSLGPEEAEKFAQVRKQYGNMLDIESIAQNGAEGGISVARLANMKDINNPQLQDLADIAAQFVKPREGMHGAAQRVGAGVLAAGAAHFAPGAAPAIAAGMAAGRGTNMALNSAALKDLLLGESKIPENARRLGGNPALRSLLYLNANRQANP